MSKIKSCDGQGCKERKLCLRFALSHTEHDKSNIYKACYYTRPNGRDCPIMIKTKRYNRSRISYNLFKRINHDETFC